MVLWFGYEVFPRRLMCWKLGPQQMALFWEVLETLGGEAQLEDLGY
jgi:hypothetical protein